MSIREGSEECSISPLEWYDIPPTQTAVVEAYDVEFLPTSALRHGGVVEFYIPASTEDYLDVKNSRLYIRAEIAKVDGTGVSDDEAVAPINNLLQSMWSNVELLANERLIAHTNNIHGYVSLLSHLLHDSDEVLSTERQMQMLYKDTASQLDATNPMIPNPNNLIPGRSYRWVTAGRLSPNDNAAEAEAEPQLLTMTEECQLVDEEDETGNHGLHQRFLTTKGGRTFEMLGNIRMDLFEQIRYLPNGMSLKLRLHPQKWSFALMCPPPEAGGNPQQYQLKILKKVFCLVMQTHCESALQNFHCYARNANRLLFHKVYSSLSKTTFFWVNFPSELYWQWLLKRRFRVTTNTIHSTFNSSMRHWYKSMLTEFQYVRDRST